MLRTDSRLVWNGVLSHSQRVLKERRAPYLLSLSMTSFHGHGHWRPHCEGVPLVALKVGLQEHTRLPLSNSQNNSLICISINLCLGSSLYRVLGLLPNKVGEEGHLGLN